MAIIFGRGFQCLLIHARLSTKSIEFIYHHYSDGLAIKPSRERHNLMISRIISRISDAGTQIFRFCLHLAMVTSACDIKRPSPVSSIPFLSRGYNGFLTASNIMPSSALAVEHHRAHWRINYFTWCTTALSLLSEDDAWSAFAGLTYMVASLMPATIYSRCLTTSLLLVLLLPHFVPHYKPWAYSISFHYRRKPSDELSTGHCASIPFRYTTAWFRGRLRRLFIRWLLPKCGE